MQTRAASVQTRVSGGRVISIEYRIRLRSGEVVEATQQQPVDYLHGGGQLLPALEHRLEGLREGERAAFSLAAEDAYGDRDDGNLLELPRSVFPDGVDLHPGAQLLARASGGQPYPITVREVRADQVLVDLNHPLAGERLFFEVRILAVRNAADDELFLGKPHEAERV